MLPLSGPDDIELAEPTPAKPNLSDVGEAAFELASMDTVVNTYARNVALDEIESRGGKMLTVEEANTRFKNVPKAFDKPISELAAFHLDDEASRRKQLEQMIEDGPTGSGVTNFVAGAVAHVLDPVETLGGILTGGALSVAGRTAARSAIPAIANIGAKLAPATTLPGVFAREAAENFVGGMVTEAYVVKSASRAQQDYGWQDAFVNSFGSALIGGAASTGFKFTLTKYGSKTSLAGLPSQSPKTTELAINGTIRQLESDRIPTPDVVEQVFQKQAYGEPNPKAAMGEVRANYVHKALDVNTISETSLFTPTAMTNSLDAGSRKFGQEFGDGLTLTDNPHIANNISGHPLLDGPTSVGHVKLENARILDLDSLDPETGATFRQQVDAIRMKIDEGKATDADLDAFNQTLKSAGYDGYKLEVTDQAQPFNQVHIFPESVAKVKAEAFTKTDLSALPEFDQSAMQRAKDSLLEKEGGLFSDAGYAKALNEEAAKPVQIATPEKIKKDLEESTQTLDRMEAGGFLSDEQVLALAETKKTLEFINSREQVANDFVNCLFGGG